MGNFFFFLLAVGRWELSLFERCAVMYMHHMHRSHLIFFRVCAIPHFRQFGMRSPTFD